MGSSWDCSVKNGDLMGFHRVEMVIEWGYQWDIHGILWARNGDSMGYEWGYDCL